MKKIIISIIASLLVFSNIAAQEISNSAYFLDGYTLKHEFNPAFASARNYIALPAISGINVSTRSKLGLSSLVFPSPDGLVLFTNKSVDAQDFLSKLQKNNKVLAGANVNIISAGFWNKNGGFINFGINLKLDAGVNAPYDLFDFAKNLGAKEVYNISQLGANVNSYAEVYGGYSRNINENLRIGAKVKVLFGIAAASLNVDNLQVKISEQEWSVSSLATAKLYGAEGTFNLQNKPDGTLDFAQFDIKPQNPLGGFGAAIDLGAVYTGLVEGLTLSAAVKDLGFISWKNCVSAGSDNNKWSFSGFENFSLDEESPNSLDNQLEALKNDLSNIIILKKQGEGKAGRMLACKVNVGAEYVMPFYKRLSAGFLYSGRFNNQFSSNEARVYATVSPTDWFSFSANYGLAECGSMLGAAINFHATGFSLFLATDSIVTNVTPKFDIDGVPCVLPVNKSNVNLNLGLAINISKRKDR